MPELITAIAMLCQIHVGSNTTAFYVMKIQRECQQELVECALKAPPRTAFGAALIACLTKKK